MLIWDKNSWPEIKDQVELGITDAVLPIGSIEQHGPHLPLSTDLIIARNFASAMLSKVKAFMLPALSVTISKEHSSFPGTLWIDKDLFKRLVKSYNESIKKQGIRRLILLNAHGGNKHALQELEKENKNIVVLNLWDFKEPRIKYFGEKELHAGAFETSLMLLFEPTLVKLNLARGEWDESFKDPGNWKNSSHGVIASNFDRISEENAVKAMDEIMSAMLDIVQA